MQIVIDIPNWLYNAIMEHREPVYSQSLGDTVRDGTPLPKGHGRLIDADALEGHRQIQIVPRGNGRYTEVTTYYQNDIDVAQTVIDADKEEIKDAD